MNYTVLCNSIEINWGEGGRGRREGREALAYWCCTHARSEKHKKGLFFKAKFYSLESRLRVKMCYFQEKGSFWILPGTYELFFKLIHFTTLRGNLSNSSISQNVFGGGGVKLE